MCCNDVFNTPFLSKHDKKIYKNTMCLRLTMNIISISLMSGFLIGLYKLLVYVAFDRNPDENQERGENNKEKLNDIIMIIIPVIVFIYSIYAFRQYMISIKTLLVAMRRHIDANIVMIQEAGGYDHITVTPNRLKYKKVDRCSKIWNVIMDKAYNPTNGHYIKICCFRVIYDNVGVEALSDLTIINNVVQNTNQNTDSVV